MIPTFDHAAIMPHPLNERLRRTILDERLNNNIMKLSYIILTESNERLDMNQANEYQPNEFCWINLNDSGRDYGLRYQPNDCTGLVFTTDPNDSEPIMAMSVPFQAFSADGVLLFEDKCSAPFWL